MLSASWTTNMAAARARGVPALHTRACRKCRASLRVLAKQGRYTLHFHTVHLNVSLTMVVVAGAGGLGDEEMDVAVFRFTLGIPGFEDRLIPRVVGVIGGAMLGLNHILATGSVPQVNIVVMLHAHVELSCKSYKACVYV
jgi:hypothetical protein